MKFWKFAKNEAKESELLLEGVIASESWWDDEVSPKQFRDELEKHEGNITVRINSPGGDVFAGVQIYNMLKDREGSVTVVVDALAASAASFIAMAGDKVIMNTGSMMMIHKASMIAWGNEEEMTEVAEMLKKVDDSITDIYASRTGKSKEEIKTLLGAETWMTADEAVEMGFADEAVEGKTKLSQMVQNVMKLTSDVNNAALQPAMSLKNKLEVKSKKEDQIKQVNNKESKMTDEEKKALLEKEAKEAVQNALKESQDNIATEGIVAKAKPSQNEAPVTAGYLKTQNSLVDFANVLKMNAGKSFTDVKDAWKGQLVKNGLADADYFELPEPLITAIEDAVKASGIYNLLNHTGLDVFKITWDDTDSNADTSRAGGHKKGDTKDEQILDFEKRVIRAQYIYKYLVLDKETIRENKSTGALVRFVLNELPVRIIRELERAVVIGDGRATDNKRHITSFLSIKADVTANNIFASRYEPLAGDSAAESVAKATDLIEAEGTVVMIAKKGYATAARFEKDVDGKLLFPIGTKATEIFNVSTILEPTWFTDTTDPEFDAYLIVFSAYKTVGDNSIEAFTNFKLETNEEEFLQEIYKGGALSERKAAVGIKSTNS